MEVAMEIALLLILVADLSVIGISASLAGELL